MQKFTLALCALVSCASLGAVARQTKPQPLPSDANHKNNPDDHNAGVIGQAKETLETIKKLYLQSIESADHAWSSAVETARKDGLTVNPEIMQAYTRTLQEFGADAKATFKRNVDAFENALKLVQKRSGELANLQQEKEGKKRTNPAVLTKKIESAEAELEKASQKMVETLQSSWQEAKAKNKAFWNTIRSITAKK